MTLYVDCEVDEVVEIFVGVVHVQIRISFPSHGKVYPFHIPVRPASSGRVIYFAGVELQCFQFVFYEEAGSLGYLNPGVVA